MKYSHTFSIVCCFLLATCFISCDSNQNTKVQDECISYFLDEFNMKPYEGEDLDCNTYIRLYKFEDTLFAVKDNYCADFAPFRIYDCDGEEFCFTSVSPCHIQESTDLGIIGIDK